MKTIRGFDDLKISCEGGLVCLEQGRYGSRAVTFPEALWDEIKRIIEEEVATSPLVVINFQGDEQEAA